MPSSRAVFVGPYSLRGNVSLGDGTLVRFVGFIQRAQSGGDESVNCGRTRIENHDIHLDLAATKTAGHAPEAFFWVKLLAAPPDFALRAATSLARCPQRSTLVGVKSVVTNQVSSSVMIQS